MLREAARRYPSLSKLDATRDDKAVVIFEPGDEINKREIRLDPSGLFVAAAEPLDFATRLDFIRDMASQIDALSIPSTDIDVVDLRFRYDVVYKGNHHKLISDVLLSPSPISEFSEQLRSPVVGLALHLLGEITTDSGNDITVVLKVIPATSREEIRTSRYDGDAITVLCGIGMISGLLQADSFAAVFDDLLAAWESRVRDFVEQTVVKKLTEAVA
jgi:hypothetical protein